MSTADIINELAIKIEATSREKGFMRATWDLDAFSKATHREFYIGVMGRRIMELACAANHLRHDDARAANQALGEAQEALDNLEFHLLDDPDVLSGNDVNDIKLALVATELDEFREALYVGNREHAAEEIADAIIRLLDIGASLGLDVGVALVTKVEKNKERPAKHGKASPA